MTELATGKPQQNAWADGRAPATAVTRAGLHIVPRASSSHMPVTVLSMISQQKYRHTYIYIIHSSLVPVLCPKMLRVFNFI